jgi:sigma-B regulation protein RsbU (phosphoserine phosphatase)
MCDNIVSHRFISCFYALLDIPSRTISYSNAGHCPRMLVREGSCVRMKEGGPVLGIFQAPDYEQGDIESLSGDFLVLFTDGVTEAISASGEEFGEDRLIELLAAGHKLGATDLRDRIMTAVEEFTSGEPYDDATLMVVRVE